MILARRMLPAVLAVAALGLAACGSSTKESTADKLAERAEQQQRQQTQSQPASAPAPTVTKIQPTAGERDLNKKPQIPKSSGPPPKQLKAQDLIVGNGPASAGACSGWRWRWPPARGTVSTRGVPNCLDIRPAAKGSAQAISRRR